MLKPSSIRPDKELAASLQGQVSVGLPDGSSKTVPVYANWERPTNELPDDFMVVFSNGDPEGLGMNINYARGFMAVSLYTKLKEDGSIKAERISKIIAQFEKLLFKHLTENFFFDYEPQHFLTPTTPNYTTGYSVTTLNLKWTTNSNFSKNI